MTPEAKARVNIDKMLIESGYILQDMTEFNRLAAIGVAVREFQTNSGPVDYMLFINGKPAGVVEAKAENTIRNRLKEFPPFDTQGFRDSHIVAIQNLEKSFSDNMAR